MKGSDIMQRISGWLGIMTLVTATLVLTSTQARAEQDHLLGYKAKDLNAVPAPADVAVATMLTNGNCQLKKAKFMLLQAEKNGGDDPRGGAPGNFVCYKAKCADVPSPVTADTQFGTVSMESKKAHILCLPADADICGDNELDGTEQCDGTADGACPGNCLPDCTCPPCPGEVVGGFCWFFGAQGESCDTVCGNQGRTYDAATETYAGSGGTDANCTAVLTAFGQTFNGTNSSTSGVGCSVLPVFGGFRITSPATTGAGSVGNISRACACQ
jgi:hypothetical protein